MDEACDVLVTGGAGFVGATLVRRLLASGHRVRVYDNYSTGHPVEYRPVRAGEVGRNFASYELARQMLGYRPTVTREVGVRMTWDWLTAHVFR